MVVFTTIKAACMELVQKDMALIIRERERLVNTGFAGRGLAFSAFFCDRSMLRNNSMIRITVILVQGTLATHLRPTGNRSRAH